MKVLSISAIEFGKGFSETNIMNFKKFYLKFKELTILQTLSEEFKSKNSRHCLLNLLCYPQKVRRCLTFLNLIFRITIHLSIKSSLFLA